MWKLLMTAFASCLTLDVCWVFDGELGCGWKLKVID